MVLGHPAVRAFVSHGGQGSIGEAVVNLVPLVVVPFIAEQGFNAHRVSDLGAGLWVNPHSFTEGEVTDKLTRVMRDESILAALTKLNVAARLHGGAAERAADVIESELLLGSSHLTPVEQRVPWWLAAGLDVMGAVGALLLAVLGAVWLVLRTVTRTLLACVPGRGRSRQDSRQVAKKRQ